MKSVLSSGVSTWMHSRSRAWPSLAAILVALATAPAITWAQHLGALGVSLTVLPPASTQPVALISFRVAGDGIARLETTAPIASSVSAIVMSTVSSSASGSVPLAQAPVLVNATHPGTSPEDTTRPHNSRAPQMRYQVELNPASAHAQSHDVSMHITYLIVPGT